MMTGNNGIFLNPNEKDSLLLMGDFNSRVGEEQEILEDLIPSSP